MTINLKDFSIKTVDRYNLGLFENRIVGDAGRGRKNTKNAGQKKEILIGYYGDLRGALYGYVNKCIINDTEEYDVKNIIDKLNEIENTIKEIADNVMD